MAGERKSFHSWEACAQASFDLLRDARQQVLIYSHELSEQWLENTAMYEALKDACLNSSGLKIKVVTAQARRSSQHGNTINLLAKKISSSVEYKIFPHAMSNLQGYNSALMLVDSDKVLFRHDCLRSEGWYYADSPAQWKIYHQFYETYWRAARNIAETRSI